MNSSSHKQAPPTELTGGAGFTYEDSVVALYLTALLRADHGPGMDGVVVSVAVQQKGQGNPMDDLVVEFDHAGQPRALSLQVKRAVTISAANADFKEITGAAVATQNSKTFRNGFDTAGFVAENVAVAPFRSLERLISWAKASPEVQQFEARFNDGGAAAAAERELRLELAPIIGAQTPADEASFYRHSVALHLNGLSEGGALRSALLNQLSEVVANNGAGQDVLLFDRLCHIAREGAATGTKWTRASLLAQLHGTVRLKVVPNYRDDVARLNAFSLEGLNDVSETVDTFHVPREGLQTKISKQLDKHKIVSISGLPGCGKSAVLKRFATDMAAQGPILFLKTDRLQGTGWTTFATALGLSRYSASELLAEIGSAGTSILFIDGIDRIRPDQQGIITDLIHAIENDPGLKYWKVLASSRDQGLEAYRAWFPSSFYASTGIGDIQVKLFDDDEAELLAKSKPNLRKVLFGPPAVRMIARRPFFASVLARSVADDAAPQTEVDLIAAWWARAGHDALATTVPQRQRALIDIAEKGVRNLGKGVSVRDLKDSTIEQIAALKADHIIRDERGGAYLSFTHDIFFEWSFFRLLIELGDQWPMALEAAGEPPLLGRVVGLLAQESLTENGRWTAGYHLLAGGNLRVQWRREWLTAPPFTEAFIDALEEVTGLLKANDFELCEKVLVWFQAQHTIPSPVILQNAAGPIEGVDRLRLADMLGWPSDFGSWGRLIDWLTALAPSLPIRLVPYAIEVFNVWQNAFSDFKNPRSEAFIAQCSAWLIDFENESYAETFGSRGKWDELGNEAQSSVATALRNILLRSGRSYPAPAIALLERATQSDRMLDAAYSDLMAFALIMAEVAPDALANVAETKLLEELPQDILDRMRREDKEHYAALERLRNKPEDQRTPQEERALSFPPSFPFGRDDIRDDQIGIENHTPYYHPPSALHEPFASLLAKNPAVGLRLIRNMTNHATKGWRQVQALHRRRNFGTPSPVVLEFPWGMQEFWGDWHVYSWGQGELAPESLECAYLALMYWACKEIDKGRSASEVIGLILEGSECYATVGLCLCLALEAREVSATTLPIVACQRLWHHDLQRLVQEPHKNLDLLGFGFLSRLTGEKGKAKEYLDQRKFRKREVRELAMLFALSEDDALRERFKALLAAFPLDLPYELEEERTNPAVTAELTKNAKRWAGLGDRENYKQIDYKGQAAVQYESPTPLAVDEQERLAESARSLNNAAILSWAMKTLNEGKTAEGWNFPAAIAFAKQNDSKSMFDARAETGEHYIQSAIAAIAARIIQDHESQQPELDWAWDVMARVEQMQEPERLYGSKIPWHPTRALVIALFHGRKRLPPRADAPERLIKLTAFPNEDIQNLAFQALFNDPDPRVQWIAARLAFDLSLYWRPVITKNYERDFSAGERAKDESLARALAALSRQDAVDFDELPPPWIKSGKTRRSKKSEADVEDVWIDPDPSFNGQLAAKLFPLFPIEAWCQSESYRPIIQKLLADLSAWTGERLVPSWREYKSRQDRDTHLFEWSHVLGALNARAAPFFDLEWVREHLVRPFMAADDEPLRVLAEFAAHTVTRQVLDAPEIPENTFPLLDDCIERVIRDRTFRPSGHRAGEVHGYDMPKLIDALLFVNVEKKCDGAARFANGDWSSIAIIMPQVTKLVSATGWSTYVMGKFLTLCERAGDAYPLDDFIMQSSAVLNSIANAKGAWIGTSLPARTAAIIQRLADANYPLTLDQARGLLNLLDALIDLGDRRSAALEQTEAFRRIQGKPG